jgi:hypothetical protein
MSKRHSILKLIRISGFAALSVSSCIALNLVVQAQTALPAPAVPAVSGVSDSSSDDAIARVIASNTGTPKMICPVITPLLRARPESAAKVIDQAQATPDLLEPLCECVSKTQGDLELSDPAGAKVVAKAVAASSPAFQACYAVALTPVNQDAGRPQVASNAASEAALSAARGVPYSPTIGSGASGFSGGPVSPNSP